MAYIYGLIIVALFFATMHYFTELDKKQKTIATTVVFLIILSAIVYNKYNQEQQAKLLAIQTKFEQGKTLLCNGVEVNQTQFSLSIGTFTFIGKENTPHYAEMINASTCQ